MNGGRIPEVGNGPPLFGWNEPAYWNRLYRQNADGSFTGATAAAGLGRAGDSNFCMGAATGDYDNDGPPGLFVSRYLDYKVENNVHCGTPFFTYCRPGKYSGTTNLLYRNLENGKFQDVSRETGLADLVGSGMGVAANDYDLDGWPAIFVTNDGMEQYLLHKGYYVASVPQPPARHTQARTPDEVMPRVREAIERCREVEGVPGRGLEFVAIQRVNIAA